MLKIFNIKIIKFSKRIHELTFQGDKIIYDLKIFKLIKTEYLCYKILKIKHKLKIEMSIKNTE